MKNIYFIFLSIVMFACDGITGMDGIVIDQESGQPIEDVKIHMVSLYEDLEVFSDTLGQFYTKHGYACGIVECSERFTISFEKDGYLKKELTDDFFSNAEYVEEEKDNSTWEMVYVELECSK